MSDGGRAVDGSVEADRPVIDADGHVIEPPDLWLRYMPARLRDRAPHTPDLKEPFMVVDGIELPPRRNYADRGHRKIVHDEDRYRSAGASGFSPESHLESMATEGIDIAVLFPTRGLVLMGVDGADPVITTSAAHAYNTWLSEYCAAGPGRLRGAGMVDPRDVEGAVREARRCAEDLDFVAVMMRPNPVGGRPWHDPTYEPLWSALEALDLPVCFHEGGAVRLPQVAIDRFDGHAFWHACTHPMEQQMAMLSIVLGGVAERHPRLRFAFLECGAGWLPYWAWRMDESVETEPWEFDHLTLSPSEYVRRQCYVSIDSDEGPGVSAFDVFDAPHVVWGSDYPHPDSKFPNARATLARLPGMSAPRFAACSPTALCRCSGRRWLRLLEGEGLTSAPLGDAR